MLLVLLLGCSGPSTPPDAGVQHRYPQLPNGGGAVLREATLVSIALGPETGHHAFVRWLSESNWLVERSAEYGIERVSVAASVDLAAPTADVDDGDIRAMLRARGVSPGNVYVVWGPPGIAITDRYGNRTCFSNPGTGYHEHLDEEDVAYVVVPGCPPRFSAQLQRHEAMHLDAARLLVDALTNPSPRNAPAFALSDPTLGWSSLGPEAGDFCWGRLVERDGHTLQRVWSNAAIARGDEPCLPAPAGAKAFGFEVDPAGRRTLSVAETITLTVRGWSSGEVPDWPVQIVYWSGDFTMQASLDKQVLNDGVSATLELSVPFPVAKGTAGAILLRGMGRDDTPQWPVAFITR